MNSIKNILGFSVLIAGAVAMVVNLLLPDQAFVVSGLLIFAALAAAAWLALSYRAVIVFVTKKSTRNGANLAFVIFLVLGILTFVNILAKQYNWRKDMTRVGSLSLSPQTVKLLSELDQDVRIYHFAGAMSDERERQRQDTLFKNIQYYSKRVKFESVDPDRRPTLAQSLGVKRKDTVVLQLGDSAKRISVEGSTEEKVTNGLIKLLKTKDQTVYFTVGHDERDLGGAAEDPYAYSALKSEIEKQGYAVKELSLINEGKVPADAAALVVAGARSEFFPKELEAISAFVQSGGRALIAVDVDVRAGGLAKGSRQLAPLLKPFGVSLHEELLVDPISTQAKLDSQILFGFVATYTHPILRDFPSSNRGIVPNFQFPLTGYLTHEKLPGVTVTPLVQSSPSAWAESDWASIKTGVVRLDKDKDHQGIMHLAYSIERAKENERGQRLAIFATSHFAGNGNIEKKHNRDLFLNSLAWVCDDDKLLSIRARDEGAADRIDAAPRAMTLVFGVTVIVLPLTLVILGIVVWRRRRKL